MDQEYDAIILGTGLKECLLAGLLSVDGKKILHMDRNSYYGGESASLNLKQLYEKFKPGQELPPHYGRWQDWNFDMVPKFMMGNGLLVRVLVHTGVHKYLEFKAVDGSYVVKGGKTYKVPANDKDALRSSLMGMFEKYRARSFFIFVQDYEKDDPRTHKGYDLDAITSRELFKEYGLDPNTVDFIGHALALQTDDSFMDQPARKMVMAVKLYSESSPGSRPTARTSTPSTASASCPRVSRVCPRCTAVRTCSPSPTLRWCTTRRARRAACRPRARRPRLSTWLGIRATSPARFAGWARWSAPSAS